MFAAEALNSMKQNKKLNKFYFILILKFLDIFIFCFKFVFYFSE